MTDKPLVPWPGADDPAGVIKEALREYVGDGDGADLWVLDQYTRRAIADALGRAKVSLDLEDLASHYFIASDGVGSVGINTNDTAKNKVLKGLDDLAKQYLRGRA